MTWHIIPKLVLVRHPVICSKVHPFPRSVSWSHLPFVPHATHIVTMSCHIAMLPFANSINSKVIWILLQKYIISATSVTAFVFHLKLVAPTASTAAWMMTVPPNAANVTTTRAWASRVTISRRQTTPARPAPVIVRSVQTMAMVLVSVTAATKAMKFLATPANHPRMGPSVFVSWLNFYNLCRRNSETSYGNTPIGRAQLLFHKFLKKHIVWNHIFISI